MKKLETVYFAVVDVVNPLTGDIIFDNKELILSEDVYYEFSFNDDEDDVFIEWSEEWEVLTLEDDKFLLVNYTNSSGEYHKGAYEVFSTKNIGSGVDEFTKWDKGQVEKI